MLVKTAKALMELRLMHRPLKEVEEGAEAGVRAVTGVTDQAEMGRQAAHNQALLQRRQATSLQVQQAKTTSDRMLDHPMMRL